MRKNRKGQNSYGTIEEVKDTQKVKSKTDTENKELIIEKELDTIQKLVNSLKKSSEQAKHKSTNKLNTKNKDISESLLQDTKKKENLGQDQNFKFVNNNIVAKFNVPKLNGSNKCKNQSNICPSKKETGTKEDCKTQQISKSSHTLNNARSNEIINSISSVVKTETSVHTQNNVFVDNDTPFRLMRSQSTSTCSALYSPILKCRQNNDLRFHQQKGRYSDTVCSR